MPVLGDIHVQALRQKFASVCVERTSDHQAAYDVRKILLVGGVFSDDPADSRSGLSFLDNQFLEETFTHLREHNVHVAPDFEVVLCNIIYGEDFLTEQEHADLVVICNIFQASPGANEVFARTMPSFFLGEVLSNPHGHQKSAWDRSALNSDAVFLSVAHGEMSGDLKPEAFPSYLEVATSPLPGDFMWVNLMLRKDLISCPLPSPT